LVVGENVRGTRLGEGTYVGGHIFGGTTFTNAIQTAVAKHDLTGGEQVFAVFTQISVLVLTELSTLSSALFGICFGS